MSAILAALGLYMLGHSEGTMIYVGALVFGMGVCYFWPTMLGFVAENLPKTGAVGMNLMGGAGMFAVSIYLMIMGGYYDTLLANKLPAGSELSAYVAAAPGTQEALLLEDARRLAGPEVINFTMTIPIILTIAFAGLVFYMRGRKKPSLQAKAV